MIAVNSLIFRKGFKDWDTTYRVDIGFEYTADLEKKITDLLFSNLETGGCLKIPWSILQPYIQKKEKIPYVDSSGLKVTPVENGLLISDSRMFSLCIREDQMEAIEKAVNNVKEEISASVERILHEFMAQRKPTQYESRHNKLASSA